MPHQQPKSYLIKNNYLLSRTISAIHPTFVPFYSITALNFVYQRIFSYNMKTIHLKKTNKQTTKSDISVLCNGMGLLTFLSLMIYFLIMRSIGLHELFALRDINFIFLTGGIFFGLYLYGKESKSKIDYLTGIKIGTYITLIAIIPFSILIYSYLATDIVFMNLLTTHIKASEFLSIPDQFINPLSAAGIIFLEGLFSGILLTFIAMHYFKK